MQRVVKAGGGRSGGAYFAVLIPKAEIKTGFQIELGRQEGRKEPEYLTENATSIALEFFSLIPAFLIKNYPEIQSGLIPSRLPYGDNRGLLTAKQAKYANGENAFYLWIGYRSQPTAGAAAGRQSGKNKRRKGAEDTCPENDAGRDDPWSESRF